MVQLDTEKEKKSLGSRVEVKLLVFSTGGLMIKATASLLKSWKAKLGDWGYEQMMNRIGLCIESVRAKGKSFEMGT